jgi:LmbE family N-acetylglucosaminyl deacetylase
MSPGSNSETTSGWAAQLGHVVAISPHLDDAVLSAGGLLAQLVQPQVYTVFAGFPIPLPRLTEWDAECGFAEGDDVVALRREEDRRALQRLGATAHWLDFLDSQYSEARPSASDIAAALATPLKALACDTIMFPLGIDHDDHIRTHEACAVLLAEGSLAANWVAWADVPYRIRSPELIGQRINSLQRQGYRLDRAVVAPGEQKMAAVKEYPSQIKGLSDADDAWQPEEFYVVTR